METLAHQLRRFDRAFGSSTQLAPEDQWVITKLLDLGAPHTPTQRYLIVGAQEARGGDAFFMGIGEDTWQLIPIPPAAVLG